MGSKDLRQQSKYYPQFFLQLQLFRDVYDLISCSMKNIVTICYSCKINLRGVHAMQWPGYSAFDLASCHFLLMQSLGGSR